MSSKPSKTIFMTIGEAPVMHNVVRTGFWKKFMDAHKDDRIVLIVKPEKKDFYQEELGAENITIETIEPRPTSKLTVVLSSMARNAIDTHTNLWEKWRAHRRGETSAFFTQVKHAYTKTAGNISFIKRLIRSLFTRFAQFKDVADVFNRYEPDVLFAPSLTNFDFDIPVAVEARRRGVRTVGMVRSWDNFTSHGLLRVLPDVFLLQNKYLREVAKVHQVINEKETAIEQVGLPHYDKYKDESWLISREAFCEKTGFDPNKKIIFYGAMGDFLFPNEGTVADVFESLIEDGSIKGAQVLFRAHPRFMTPLERITDFKHVKGDRKATYTGSDFKTMEIKDEDMAHLINSIYHADVVVTGGSTIAIDGAALGKPCVCVGFDGTAKDVDHWMSVERFYDTYTHFEALVGTGGVRVAYTPEKLAEEINEYLKNPERDKEGRDRIIEEFVAPFDGRAGERVAELLEEHIS